VFVDVVDPVKFSVLTLSNVSGLDRHLSVFAYHEWVLGPPRDGERAHVITESEGDTVFASNPYNGELPGRVAFVRASEPLASASGNRGGFIGRNGTLANPAALEVAALDGRFGAGLDPCAAIQLRVHLQPGEIRQVVVLLGEGIDRAHAHALIARHASIQGAAAALDGVREFWNRTLDAVRVSTPDDSFDALLNRWLVLRFGRDETSFTAGVSYKFAPFNLDVAYVNNMAQSRVGDLFGTSSRSFIATLNVDYRALMPNP